MSKITLLALVLLCAATSGVSAQKAKFKSKIVTVQQARLPTNLTDVNSRTYDVIVKGQYADGVESQSKKLYGWTRNEETPNVKAVISAYSYNISSAKKNSEKKQTKDKEGNVTKSWTEYWYTGSAVGKGKLFVYGHSAPFSFVSSRKKMTKAQERAAAAAEAEKEELANNPFLSDDMAADAEDAAENDGGVAEGLTGDDLPLVKTVPLDQTTSVSSAHLKSSSAAYKDYADNQRPKLVDARSSYAQKVYNSAISSLNAQYGFAPVNNRFYLKEMKSDKHSEFKTWNSACQAVATIFKTYSFNQSIDASKLDPIIAYFEGQVNAIPANDKKAAKHKKAAYNNLLNVLYFADRHDEVITWSEKYLEDKKLDKVAKRMVNKSERMQALLAFHSMETCHYETTEEFDPNDIEETEMDSDDNGDGK